MQEVVLNTLAEKVHDTLKDLREKCGVTRKYLALKLGISETSYYYKETGKCPFTIEEYRILYSIYKEYDPSITAEDFFVNTK